MTGRRRFGRVRKLPSGRYQARYSTPDGREHPAPDTFVSKTAADRWLASVETDMARGQWVDPRSRQLPLSAYAESWANAQAAASAASEMLHAISALAEGKRGGRCAAGDSYDRAARDLNAASRPQPLSAERPAARLAPCSAPGSSSEPRPPAARAAVTADGAVRDGGAACARGKDRPRRRGLPGKRPSISPPGTTAARPPPSCRRSGRLEFHRPPPADLPRRQCPRRWRAAAPRAEPSSGGPTPTGKGEDPCPWRKSLIGQGGHWAWSGEWA
jgi:hypothetical protein